MQFDQRQSKIILICFKIHANKVSFSIPFIFLKNIGKNFTSKNVISNVQLLNLVNCRGVTFGVKIPIKNELKFFRRKKSLLSLIVKCDPLENISNFFPNVSKILICILCKTIPNSS